MRCCWAHFFTTRLIPWLRGLLGAWLLWWPGKGVNSVNSPSFGSPRLRDAERSGSAHVDRSSALHILRCCPGSEAAFSLFTAGFCRRLGLRDIDEAESMRARRLGIKRVSHWSVALWRTVRDVCQH